MKYDVKIENELNNFGSKKEYDIFSNRFLLNHSTPPRYFPHIHSYYETILILEGEFKLKIDGSESVILSQGDIIFIPSYVVHEPFLIEGNMPIMRSIVVKFSPLFLYPLETTQSDVDCLLNTPVYKEKYYLFKKGEQYTDSLERVMRKILNEKKNQRFGYEFALRALLSTFYLKLVRICACNEKTQQHPTQDISEDSAQKLHQIFLYVKENYQYNISMREASDLCGMNYNYFSRFFKKVAKQNFKEYLLDVRLNHAQKQLLQSEKSVSTIAMECGFEYAAYFVQKFKKKVGLTPLEYRKKYQNSMSYPSPSSIEKQSEPSSEGFENN